MLTFQQEKLLKFIIDYQKQNNVTPSFDEMKDGLDLKSKSGIHRILSALEERGYIKKLNNRARAIEIIKNVRAPIKLKNILENIFLQNLEVYPIKAKAPQVQINML